MAPKRGRKLTRGLPEDEVLAPPPRRAFIFGIVFFALAVSAVSFYLLAGLNGGVAASAEGPARALRGGEIFPTQVPLPSRAPPEPAAAAAPVETFCTPDHCGQGANRGAKFTWP
jgi:hypothetical protein